jgi:hypothetical protein
MVESSSRSSAHTNVLDALKAVDMCTSPAVHQLHLEGEKESNNNTVPSGTGWQDLAAFLFGADWQQERVTQPTAGGKVGPSSIAKKQTKKGWNAPYLDEIPNFPQASPSCANPHTLPRNVALSLYGETDASDDTIIQHEQELKSMPDEAFVTEWGAVQEEKGRVEKESGATKRKQAQEEPEEAPPAKRVKWNDGKPAAAAEDKHKPKSSRPPHVPSFLPLFPKSGPGRAIVADDTTTPLVPSTLAATTTSSTTNDTLGVRSSLVKMEQHYWGSGWDAPAPAIKVPLGRTKTTGTTPPAVVEPLGRASQHRSSRIIEGSMDAMN